MADNLMTLQEVAEFLAVPVATVYAWRHKSEGPTGFKVGRHVRYARASVEAWLEKQADPRHAA
jgi:excisionase family DNA binding protein